MPAIVDTADFVMPDSDTNAADRSLVVRFSMQPRLDAIKTATEGREIYKDVEFITILIPGDKTFNVHRPIMKSDLARFPTQYAAFKNQRGQVVEGTPLAGWPLATESQRRELEYFNIRTVEQLAAVNDSFAGSMMGVQQLKAAAQRYITAAKERAPLVKLTRELESRDAEIATLKSQMAEVLAKLAAPTPKPEKGAK